MKESPLLVKLLKNYVPEQPTCGVSTDLEIPKAKKRGLSSFSVVGARLWNSLPPGNRDLPS